MDSAIQNAILSVNKLHFAYHQRPILHDVNLQLKQGGLLTLLGRNGVGKSTLLNCTAGLLKPTSGSILVDNRAVSQLKAKDLAQLVAYVSQNAPQTYRYTVLEYTLLGRAARLGITQQPSQADHEHAHNALQTLGIEHLANQIYMETSGGQKQLINIAKALVQEPKLILFDEPTSALDYGNATKILQLIADLSQRGYSIIMTTHNPEHPLLLHQRCPHSQTAILDGTGSLHIGLTHEVITEEHLQNLYQIPLQLITPNGWQRQVCALQALS